MIDLDLLIKNATLSHDKVALNAYKNLKAEVQKNQTAKGAKPLTEELQIQIFSKYLKNLQDAISQFSEAGRSDLVSEYTDELQVVEKLLPKPATLEELENFINNDEKYFDKFWVSEFIDDGEATTMKIQIPKKEMGASIKYLKSKFPTTNGKLISKIISIYAI
jgi:uncharacterized protein YqeY